MPFSISDGSQLGSKACDLNGNVVNTYLLYWYSLNYRLSIILGKFTRTFIVSPQILKSSSALGFSAVLGDIQYLYWHSEHSTFDNCFLFFFLIYFLFFIVIIIIIISFFFFFFYKHNADLHT